MWENLRTIIISSVMTLIILGTLIWAGVVPIRQEANTYQIKQTISETFTITGTATSQTFTYPITNITGPTIARTMYIYAEFNATNNPKGKDVFIRLQLSDNSFLNYEEVSAGNRKFDVVTMNEGLSIFRGYSLTIYINGANISGILSGIIIQNVIRS